MFSVRLLPLGNGGREPVTGDLTGEQPAPGDWAGEDARGECREGELLGEPVSDMRE